MRFLTGSRQVRAARSDPTPLSLTRRVCRIGTLASDERKCMTERDYARQRTPLVDVNHAVARRLSEFAVEAKRWENIFGFFNR